MNQNTASILNGGISKGPHDFPHGPRIQIEVENIDESIKKSVEAGAQIVRDKMEFEHYDLAYFVDRRNWNRVDPIQVTVGVLRRFARAVQSD
jgi:predicted enzyme related to lactoylglutathione lyase